MATPARRETTYLETEVCKRSSSYSFAQVLRLLRLISLQKDGRELFDNIRVRPELSLNFPYHEVTTVEKPKDAPFRFLMTVTFLGMYGTGSPLPMFYTQELFKEEENNLSVSRDFIDTFNSVLYEAYFYAWKKYNLFYSLFEDSDSALKERLLYLAGLSGEKFSKRFSSPHHQVRYTGLSARPVKTAEGLRAIVADTLAGPSVTIEQCVTRMASIPKEQLLRLNISSNVLGKSTVVGRKVLDRMGSFRIHLGPIQSRSLKRYLPDSTAMAAIAEQVRFYLDQPLEWDVAVSCYTRGMATVQLGSKNKALLGWNTWVFTGKLPEKEVSARFTVSQYSFLSAAL